MSQTVPTVVLVWMLTLSFCAGFDVTVSESTTIVTNDTVWEGMAIVVDGATLTIDGCHTFAGLHLTNGAALTHTAQYAGGMQIHVTGDLYVAADASIDVSGKGYAGGNTREDGAGSGGGQYGCGGSGGGGYGGNGGVGIAGPDILIAGGNPYGDSYGPMQPGSGGGGSCNSGVMAGSGGGLAILRVDGVMTLDGAILANGTSGQEDIWSPPGSGAGGGIWVWADTISGHGHMQACGGNGFAGTRGRIGGGGSGGRVALFTSSDMTFATSSVSVAGGTLGSPPAEAGSLVVHTGVPVPLPAPPTIDGYLLPPTTNWVQAPTIPLKGSRDNDCSIWCNGESIAPFGAGNWHGTVRMQGDAMTVAYYSRDIVGRTSPTNTLHFARDPAFTFIVDDTHVPVADTTYDGAMVVVDNATLTLDGHHDFAGLMLTNGALLSHSSAVTGLAFTVTGNLIAGAGARIDVRGLGCPGGPGGNDYAAGHGPGGGLPQWYDGGGGSHGGVGATSSGGADGGPTYDRAIYPIESGSGGGGAHESGGGMPGGGTVWIHAGETIVLDGVINASGVDYEPLLYQGGGGGAGGSVILWSPALSGSGYIDASGGDATAWSIYYGGGGGGGRVAIYSALDGFALTNISVAGGSHGNPAAEDGTLHHCPGVPPAIVDQLVPSGYVTQTVADVSIGFWMPIDTNSVAPGDIIITGPQACEVSVVNVNDDRMLVARLATALQIDGAYRVSVGPDIESFAGGAMDGDGDGLPGEVPDDAVAFTFTIDRTPPAMPVVTNVLAAPSVNLVNSSLPRLGGIKDADSVILCESRQIVPAGQTAWSCRVPLDTGSNTVTLTARDPAGNESAPTRVCLLCDLLEPRVVSVTPDNGAVVSEPPDIAVTCDDRPSGPDLASSFLEVARDGAPVGGQWHCGASRVASFAPDTVLADGDYAVTVIARDRAGTEADPFVSHFEIRTPEPTAANSMPAWWTERDIVSQDDRATNDFAALNRGQLKWMAHCAGEAFEAELPFGAGDAIDAMIGGFTVTQNYCAVNVGQLKSTAAPYYDRLGLELPWDDSTPRNDWAIANVGQIKFLFDLSLGEDEDADGLPDWWEVAQFGSNGVDDAADDSDGDGLSEREEFANRTSPDAVDSDLDSVSDFRELLYGSDPADAASFPVDVSGAIAYAGSVTGATHVVAATWADGWSGCRCGLDVVPCAYVISNAISGRPTWIKAFIDANGNATCDPWEPVGVAAGAPHSLVLAASDIDIVLTHPDLDGDGMDDRWEMNWFGTLLTDPYADTDGDGKSNRDEFDEGGDPLADDGGAPADPPAPDSAIGDVGLRVFTPAE